MNAAIEWPPDYTQEWSRRQEKLWLVEDNDLSEYTFEYYRVRPIEFIEDWCITSDPRNAGTDKPTILPFVLFPDQRELINFFYDCIKDQDNGLVEKSRDMGATWAACAFSVWLWLFWPGSSVGWGSRKQELVDRRGDPDSIFEKIRMLIRKLPQFLKPQGFKENEHLTFMKCINPENGATITGESGDNIGRGGRKLIYFKDESAHYERAESIEAALADNTNCQIDISSVNGAGNIFYRKRHSEYINVFILDWRNHPAKTQEWYDKRKALAESQGLEHIFAQEVDRDYTAAVEGIFIPAKWVNAAIDAHIKLGFEPFGARKVGLDVADEGGDANALIDVYGPVVMNCDMWKQGTTGVTALTAYNYCIEHGIEELIYDSVGVGAGVKSKTKELEDNFRFNDGPVKNKFSERLKVTPFNAGSGVVQPKYKYMEGKKNEDMFFNLAAQAMWALRDRFLKTYNMVEGIEQYDHSELISLPSDLPHLHELKLEISTPLRVTDDVGRVRRETKKAMKKRGMQSPNLLEALMQCYSPLHRGRGRYIGGELVH